MNQTKTSKPSKPSKTYKTNKCIFIIAKRVSLVPKQLDNHQISTLECDNFEDDIVECDNFEDDIEDSTEYLPTSLTAS